MIKKSLVTVLIVVVAYFAYQNFQTEVANYPSQNQGIVAFGDSLTYGIGSTADGGFVKMLSADLGLPIINLGKSGDTTSTALTRVHQVVEQKPAVTIVLLGGNDFLQKIPEEETLANLGKIIEAIHRSGSMVILVGLESEFENLAEKYKTAYVPDVLEGIWGYPEMMSDNLHPNDAGYKLMAERIKPTLKRLLSE
ncbi:MAG: GDSL-type esterase/lipase family protein [bacterium]|nr:GDSL-type esterase/lipase family protein [bacterium]